MTKPEHNHESEVGKQEQQPEEESAPGRSGDAGVAPEKSDQCDESEAAEGESGLDAALAEVEKYRDLALRAEAEMANVRRRAERDVENAHKYGLERFIGNLLPVLDSLEKAVESAEEAAGENGSEADKAIVEGVGLCRKMLLDVLAKEGVGVVEPEGEPFDPNLHQAMSMVENPDVEPNSVVAVVQKGYTLNDRLVRPAMVMVSKASAEESSEP